MHPLAQVNTQPRPLPQVDWRAIAPELALAGAAVVLLLVVAFWPGARRGLATCSGVVTEARHVVCNCTTVQQRLDAKHST